MPVRVPVHSGLIFPLQRSAVSLVQEGGCESRIYRGTSNSCVAGQCFARAERQAFSHSQALWLAVHQGQDERIRELERQLAEAQEVADVRLWTLHELSNGAGRQAIDLYRAGELQLRISSVRRNRVQRYIWEADGAMRQAIAP